MFGVLICWHKLCRALFMSVILDNSCTNGSFGWRKLLVFGLVDGFGSMAARGESYLSTGADK